MEEQLFITIEDSKNHYNDFVNFMDATTEALRLDSNKRHDYYLVRNGEKLEKDVLECMKTKAKDYCFDPNLIYHTKPQHFPDIISNGYYGVEVKTTQSNSWKSTGSSIVESLREDQIKKVFMFFGILSKKNIDFRCKPYEDCLYEIAATHSPRYLINMDMSENDKTIFEKMGTTYDDFRILGDEKIEKVKKYYRNKYKSKNIKSMPWWIGENTNIDNQIVTSVENYELRLLKDLDNTLRLKYISHCYALFPEILGIDANKFRRPALWMCTRFNVICSNIRDQFTAGGKGDIYIDNKLKWGNVSKVICNLLPHVQTIKELYSTGSLYDDLDNFAIYTTDADNNFEKWITAADKYIKETDGSNRITIRELCKYRFEKKRKLRKKDCFYITSIESSK